MRLLQSRNPGYWLSERSSKTDETRTVSYLYSLWILFCRIPSLEPHHKVFLSHSGYQKPFVEQLCEDLVAHTYIPFFDQRNDSLPKGEKFAKLIFDAARQCHVGVVVLSEEYLTSKWPMLELVEFCKAADEKRKAGDQFVRVLPLYYKLSIGQIKDDSNKTRWRKKWTSFAKKDKRIDLRDWENALKLLQDVNGISLPADGSEVSYRRDIVKKIWYLCPPHVPYDLDEKEGWERICKVSFEVCHCLHTFWERHENRVLPGMAAHPISLMFLTSRFQLRVSLHLRNDVGLYTCAKYSFHVSLTSLEQNAGVIGLVCC